MVAYKMWIQIDQKQKIPHLLRTDLVIQFKDIHNTVLDAL